MAGDEEVMAGDGVEGCIETPGGAGGKTRDVVGHSGGGSETHRQLHRGEGDPGRTGLETCGHRDSAQHRQPQQLRLSRSCLLLFFLCLSLLLRLRGNIWMTIR